MGFCIKRKKIVSKKVVCSEKVKFSKYFIPSSLVAKQVLLSISWSLAKFQISREVQQVYQDTSGYTLCALHPWIVNHQLPQQLGHTEQVQKGSMREKYLGKMAPIICNGFIFCISTSFSHTNWLVFYISIFLSLREKITNFQ